MYLTNSFSINMLKHRNADVSFREIFRDKAFDFVFKHGIVSAIGHVDTAAVVSDLLGIHIEANRLNVQLNQGDEILVAQYVGPRLPEGSTTLPPDAEIHFIHVMVQ